MMMLPDRRRWPELETANQIEMLAYLGTSPYAEGQIADDLAWVITGVRSNDYNGVAWARLSAADADAQIADLLGRFRARALPFLWYVDPSSQPADLAERLIAQGCTRLGPGVAMAADLAALRPPAREVGGLVVRPVDDSRDLAAWVDVWMSIDDDEADRPICERLYASLGLGGDQPLRHYLSWLDGRPVATAQVFLAREAAGLYCVAVRREVRGRGIGTAVVSAALRDVYARGYRLALLGPTPESRRMYERLGFTLFPTETVAYTWFGEADM